MSTYVGTPTFQQNSTYTLASIIQGEASSYEGQQAVASVINNRANAGFYDGTVLGNALAPNQFQGQTTPTPQALSIATQLQNGTLADNTGGALYYANPSASTASWARSLNDTNALNIGGNYFTDQQGPASQTYIQNNGIGGATPAPPSYTPNSPTGSPIGGDGTNIADQGYSPPYTDPSQTDSGGIYAPQGIGSSGSGFYNLGQTPMSVSGDINAIGAPAGSASYTTEPLSNPSQPMTSAPGTTGSQGYSQTNPLTNNAVLSDIYTLGIPQQIAAASTAATQASQATNQQNAADTGTLSGTLASSVNAALASGTSLFVRAGILLFGLIFLAGGVWFFSRQEA
jgi:hypothetical protein